MATVKRGARIELVAFGDAHAALKTGQYWAKRLAHGQKHAFTKLVRIKNDTAWKVTIYYRTKDTEQ